MDDVEFVAALAVYGMICGMVGFPGVTMPIFFILLLGWIGYRLVEGKE